MSKAVLISIRPEWCEKIARGEKTIELRRTKPRLEPPFKCYIYRTKGKVPHIIGGKLVKMPVGGSIIGEFVCDEIKKLIRVGCGAVEPPRYKAAEASGSSLEIYDAEDIFEAACLTEQEVESYLCKRIGYAWHISALKIYAQPMELGELTTARSERLLKLGYEVAGWPVQDAPQSWRYVEEKGGE